MPAAKHFTDFDQFIRQSYVLIGFHNASLFSNTEHYLGGIENLDSLLDMGQLLFFGHKQSRSRVLDYFAQESINFRPERIPMHFGKVYDVCMPKRVRNFELQDDSRSICGGGVDFMVTMSITSHFVKNSNPDLMKW